MRAESILLDFNWSTIIFHWKLTVDYQLLALNLRTSGIIIQQHIQIIDWENYILGAYFFLH